METPERGGAPCSLERRAGRSLECAARRGVRRLTVLVHENERRAGRDESQLGAVRREEIMLQVADEERHGTAQRVRTERSSARATVEQCIHAAAHMRLMRALVCSADSM
jgi:hypothetical protein